MATSNSTDCLSSATVPLSPAELAEGIEAVSTLEAAAEEAAPTPRFTVYQVPSDYMAPTLQPGDLVEIDTAITRADRDGLFLIGFDCGDPALRRLQLLPGG